MERFAKEIQSCPTGLSRGHRMANGLENLKEQCWLTGPLASLSRTIRKSYRSL